ncbi:MAG: archaemetzincin family Zn-dependent metalloprotease [Candidatus Aminicenantia bacterium]
MEELELLAIGDVNIEMVEIIARKIENLLELNVKISANRENPEYAYNKLRGQYISNEIIKRICEKRNSKKILGIVEVDLCTPVLTFVFGEAQLDGKGGVVSLYRLKEGVYGEDEIVYERLYKEVLHEIGHLYGLTHCSVKDCVMHFSPNIRQIDSKGNKYCEACLDKLKSKLKESKK